MFRPKITPEPYKNSSKAKEQNLYVEGKNFKTEEIASVEIKEIKFRTHNTVCLNLNSVIKTQTAPCK